MIVTHEKKINDLELSGGGWKTYEHLLTDSLWLIDRPEREDENDAGYHGLFIPEIPRQMIERYTSKGEVVFDPFFGMGTTAYEALKLGRHCIGKELNAHVVRQASEKIAQFCEKYPRPEELGKLSLSIGDSTDGIATSEFIGRSLKSLGVRDLGLIILHPPYHDIVKFNGSNHRCLSACEDVESFISRLSHAIGGFEWALPRGRFLVLVMADAYHKGEVIPLPYLCMSMILQHGYRMKADIIKNISNNRAKRKFDNLWRYRALENGFCVFKHEHVMVFQKR